MILLVFFGGGGKGRKREGCVVEIFRTGKHEISLMILFFFLALFEG